MLSLGLEIDMIVKNSLTALTLYESVFETERVEVGDFVTGQNEVVLRIFGTRFHLLDENEQYGLIAPKDGNRFPIWFNIVVSDIYTIFNKAQQNSFNIIQPLTQMKEMGLQSAMLVDPFGYTWMLHQIDKEISYEERCKMLEKQGFQRRKNNI